MAGEKESASKIESAAAILNKAYTEFIKGLQIDEVLLLSASVRNDSGGRLPGSLRPTLTTDVELVRSAEKGFDAKCTLTFSAHDVEAAKEIIEIKIAFLLRYTTALPVTPSLFDIFKGTALSVNAWPYLREYLQSTIVRCGLPPFTLPLVKILPASSGRTAE
jgi:hypothetical protein